MGPGSAQLFAWETAESAPPDYRLRYLVPGAGVRVDEVGEARGLRLSLAVTTHTGIRAADVVATGGQMSVDINFDVSPPNWPLGPQFTLPVLVYNKSTLSSHAGSVNARRSAVPFPRRLHNPGHSHRIQIRPGTLRHATGGFNRPCGPRRV